MILTYIGHSGFAIQMESCTLIFDYYIDKANAIKEILNKSKRAIVFSSHSHSDHFNSNILEWIKMYDECSIDYIFSYDIKKKNRSINFPISTIFMRPNEIVKIEDIITIHSFGSTDCGCSFFIEIEGKKIFHAGDLNFWHWKDESTQKEINKAQGDFTKILNDIYEYSTNMTLAMFPVDPRIGTDYYLGAKQFVHKFNINNFIPMHFWSFSNMACDFNNYKNIERGDYYCLSLPGEQIILK
ncbi:MAG: MBL fold metallo-hydrolase [Muribaculaceae bacterium]|nr:MBL fold metallo-hydrolase [Muribaculaceae bacterium]